VIETVDLIAFVGQEIFKPHVLVRKVLREVHPIFNVKKRKTVKRGVRVVKSVLSRMVLRLVFVLTVTVPSVERAVVMVYVGLYQIQTEKFVYVKMGRIPPAVSLCMLHSAKNHVV